MQNERRINKHTSNFPIKRRNSDDKELSQKDPYHKLNETLKQLSKTTDYRTIVISPELRYLTARIRNYFPNPRIVYSSDKDEVLQEGILCVLNLACRRKHEPHTSLNFRELAERTPSPREPLYTLYFISRNVPQTTELTIISLGDFQNTHIARKFLLSQKFTNISFLSENLVTAKKRPLLRMPFYKNRFTLEEVQDAESILKAQEFARRCFNSEFNYDRAIDDLFTSHSDYFIVKRSHTNEIVATARHTWHLPNHYMPVMLAVKIKTDFHIQIENPDKINYGEAMVVYERNHSGAVAYRELIKTLFNFLITSGLDIVLTTHLTRNSHEGEFYAKTYGFKSTGVVLEYGDFGGHWALVYGAKAGVEKTMAPKFTSNTHRI